MAQEVFKRYEKKYILTPTQYVKLLEGIEGKVKPDKYGQYTISNIYFDTPDFELIRTSIEKPQYKEKLRLRCYGDKIPQPEDTVFVEIKKKFDGVVYKRRASMSLAEAEDYLYRGIHPEKEGQIFKELFWFTDRYALKPAVYLAYDRNAYTGIEDEDLRITFDTNIRCRENKVLLSEGNLGNAILPEDKILMEIKVSGRMPMWLSRLLSELQIFPISFSKYGTYFKQKMITLMKGKEQYA